jgi:hypothetical protein
MTLFRLTIVSLWKIDLTMPDFTKFPDAAEALDEMIEIEVNEGEAIFVPRGDWHFVKSHGHGTVTP